MGTADDETWEKITATRRQLEDTESKLHDLAIALHGENGNGGVRLEVQQNNEEIVEKCWTIKTQWDDCFSPVFEGFRSSREKLAGEVERRFGAFRKDVSTLRPIEELQRDARTLFAQTVTRIPELPTIDFKKLSSILASAIFSKCIIGRNDIEIGKMIEALGISDWVREGRTHIEEAEGRCPFCQQPLPPDFEAKIGEYFDAQYSADIQELQAMAHQWGETAQQILEKLDGIEASGNPFLEMESFLLVEKQFRLRIENISNAIQNRLKEPGKAMPAQEVESEIDNLQSLLERAAQETVKRNTLIDNLARNRKQLKEDVWHYLLSKNAETLSPIFKTKDNLRKKQKGLEEQSTQKEHDKFALIAKLHEFEANLTDVKPTITAINRCLQSFGFTSFHLAPSGEHAYKIQRQDNTDVLDTLSEGERSFVTFLYFYHLLHGGFTEADIEANRIVVIDDPVSSLDADVLFIVSTLVRRCIEEARNNTGRIKQVFLLTHNVYFHKEVVCKFRRHPSTCVLSDETFWLLRKNNNVSSMQSCQQNPIASTYENLWAEIKRTDSSGISLQNAMRRILEYYFKILGGLNNDEIVSEFEGTDAILCRALFSWVNDGSHFPEDSLMDYQVTDISRERYMRVFRMIFEKTNQINHYKMMMGEEAI